MMENSMEIRVPPLRLTGALNSSWPYRVTPSFVPPITEDRLGAVVPEPDDAVTVGVHDGLRHRLDDVAEHLVR
jgi:hypothetical protein